MLGLVGRCATRNGYPAGNGRTESRIRGRFRDGSAQGEGRALVGVEGGKLRGEVAREVRCFGDSVRIVDQGVQPLLRTRHTEQAHGGCIFPGIGAFGDFGELQYHVCGRGVRAVAEIERGGRPRKVGFDALYPVRGGARRLDDERQLAYLLLHPGSEGMVGVRFYRGVGDARKQPARHLLHEGARTVRVARSPGDGGGGGGDGDVLRRVADAEAVRARLKEVVGAVGDAGERGSVAGGAVAGGCQRIACGRGQACTDAAPVGGEGHGSVAGVRGVVNGVLHVATCEQCRCCHRSDKLIYPVSFHISRF